MKKSFIILIFGVLSGTLFSNLYAQSEQEQRIRGSYMLVFGRDATAGEVTYWKGQGNLSTTQLFERHRQYFTANKSVQREIIIKSYVAAFGRNPADGEINYYLNGNLNYTELIQGHVGYLVRDINENKNTVKRAYKYVLKREPTAEEIGYHVVSGGGTYLYRVAWLQDPTHTKNTITVTNAPILATVTISAKVATELKSASGLVAAGGGNLVAAGGGNLVAAGGGNLVAAGGGNLVAAGGGN